MALVSRGRVTRYDCTQGFGFGFGYAHGYAKGYGLGLGFGISNLSNFGATGGGFGRSFGLTDNYDGSTGFSNRAITHEEYYACSL